MIYTSTNNKKELVDFKAATLNGLASNNGLYVPTHIPILDYNLLEAEAFDLDIALELMKPFVGECIPEGKLKEILSETLNFELPLVKLEPNTYCLELFHGPTEAFKDVGARFMSRVLAYFSKSSNETNHILVATSGDTGAAVANGFHNVPGTQVHVLFPKGKVSEYQESQMTSLGDNIHALEVEGVFDDCQALVKQAFRDNDLRSKLKLSSANSINVARFLPQMLYYFKAFFDIEKDLRSSICFVVPSGNFGNVTAGLIGQMMGLPIRRLIPITNANDTYFKYLSTGKYKAVPSKQTLSNAMDVGDPSNFIRIQYLLKQDWNKINEMLPSISVSDKDTLSTIDKLYKEAGYVLDPHAAVGYYGYQQLKQEGELAIILGTASPKKFASVIQQVIPTYESPNVNALSTHKISLPNDYHALLDYLSTIMASK